VYPLLLLMLLAQAETAQDRSQRARQALLSGNSTEAIALYRSLVREFPTEPGMRVNLALAWESAGEYTQELEQLQIVVKQKPDMANVWLMMGLAWQKLEKPERAIDPLKRALALDPMNRVAKFELADAYLATGKPEEAAEHFRQLVQDDPNQAKAWQGLGLSYTGLSQMYFSRLESHSGEWCFLAGLSELNQQHYNSAFALLREALQKRPALPGIHTALAQVYEKTGHSDWAATERSREGGSQGTAPTVHPDYVKAVANQELARQAFEHLQTLPESAELFELMAEADQRRGLRAESLKEWRKAVALAPRDMRLAGKLAESLWLNRSHEEAMKILQPLVTANPKSAQWRYLLGDVLYRLQRSEEALPNLLDAVRIKPDLLAAHAVLGRIYLQLGQPAEAIPHLLKGRSLDDAAISFQLGQAYRQAGKTDLAEQAFARAKQLQAKAPPEMLITQP
jgi:tetratricopeptide (TPR) repeat protein